ncbi:rhomboid family intramembrane serine protease [Pedobacter punctiformis]|uniref:Rhomboid family intramembrane serine protease n=1 Tax=Pedobacter punctiformis TaxID=3004097 RepID=A0ABT4L4V7_9SPHI|nr:rhomboid family intramembrane serine protease [Pedobacter sp. HCMS5-2]MCZ4242963.1 rhomboid family intramembrane serine protease [Pedobacter sp. HCMS5-2]
MSISWGYSPKIEKYIPLADFPADRYLIIARQVIENLGWKLSHISETGLIAYTPISFQSYSEEISIRILNNFAVVKSECVGIQLLLNDYGKNDSNLEKFFHEFEYAQYHLQEVWDQKLTEFHEMIATQDDTYFEKAPLATKNKIKNVLYLFFPQKGYLVTPILVVLNVLYYALMFVISAIYASILFSRQPNSGDVNLTNEFLEMILNFGVNNRNLVLEGQFWRLFTYQFIHGSLWHLFFNMYALIYLGLMIENKLGWKKFLFIYLLSGACGGLLSLSFHQMGIMIGASGSIMGLYGAFLALLINNFYEKYARQSLLISTLCVVSYILINGAFGQRVDNAAHIGGFISGFVLCYILTFKANNFIVLKPIARYAVSVILFLLLSGAVLHFSPRYQTEEFYKLKDDFNKNLMSFNGLMHLKISQSKDEKLFLINSEGIIPAKKNIEITKKMQSLTLKKIDAFDREKKAEIARKSYRAAMLMYKDVQADSTFRYSKTTSTEIGDVVMLCYKLSDTLSKMR